MEQPDHDLRPFQTNPLSPSRLFAMAASILVVGGGILALASGLAQQIIKLPDEFKAEVVKEAPPPEDKAPPPPPPDLAKPPPPFVPPPDINITTEAPSNNAISNVQNKIVAPPPPAPAKVERPSPPVGIESTHTTPDYPPISRRLGEQGTVLLRITVAADGEITEASVEQSSGYSRLDQAAVDWVKRHWRYRPATEGGKPIASSTLAKVRFDLRG